MSPIAALSLACAAFVATHLLLSHPLRDRLVSALGEGAFRGVYSLVALASFAAIILCWRAVPVSAPAYVVPDWLWITASLLMLFASVLLVGSFIGNPALPARYASSAAARNPVGVLAITRHPMMWSFAIWAIVHMLIWPTAENHVLTLAILVLALVGSLGQDGKKARLMADAWRGWMRRTAFVPFSGQISGRIPWAAAWPGWFVLIVGTLLWLGMTWAHTPLGSRAAAGIWHWM